MLPILRSARYPGMCWNGLVTTSRSNAWPSLEVFGEQVVAAEFGGARDDEAVPPRQRDAVLEVPGRRHGGLVDHRRLPRPEVSDVVALLSPFRALATACG
jgi:hypothetical protein